MIVFTILMLLHRENMREKLIGLIGPRRINITTQALDEASYRVSRYLFMQLVMNACFGIPFGIALYFIGIPNAMLWGLLATLLRFIPYAGVWIAVSMPVVLAFAISDGWAEVGWVLGVFLALELVLVNIVEPLVYGRSAGLSPIAIILAALFWTWLWGPVGLLLATPLTVCVAVMGRYIPELGYLNVILGVEPVLTPQARFYQRLVAMDERGSRGARRGVRQRARPARAVRPDGHPGARPRRAGPPRGIRWRSSASASSSRPPAPWSSTSRIAAKRTQGETACSRPRSGPCALHRRGA